MYNAPRAVSAFTLVEIMIVVAIIGLISAIAIPNYINTSARAKVRVCYENLSQIESAKEIWAIQSHKKNGEIPGDTDLFGPDGLIKFKPQCPSGGVYDLMPIGENATCTISGHTLTP